MNQLDLAVFRARRLCVAALPAAGQQMEFGLRSCQNGDGIVGGAARANGVRSITVGRPSISSLKTDHRSLPALLALPQQFRSQD